MTFLQNGRPDPDTEEQILAALVFLAEQSFGREFTADEISVVRSFYDPVAQYLASQQRDLAEVVDSTQIDHAEGASLDLLAALIGVSRREALPSTTRVQFQNDDPVTRDYPVPEGTGAQTDSADTVRFDTDEATTLPYIDGFEDQDITNYSGDTGIFSVQSTTVHTGTYALQAESSEGTMLDPEDTIEVGTRFHFKVYLEPDAQASFLFGATTQDDHYKLVIDSSNALSRVDVVEGGSESQVGSETEPITTGEWLNVQLDWMHDGEFAVDITDSSDAEVISYEASENIPTFEVGGYGFGSEDAASNKYFDEVTTSQVSVDATATESGSETNVGEDSLIVMSSSVPGVDTVTNPVPGENGRDEEPDDDFRERAKDQLSDALRATLPALITRLQNMEETRTVTVIDNDTNSTDSEGRPGHSFEAIVDVDAEYYEEVAQLILDTKAIGDTSVGGHAGSAVTRTLELSNEQEKDITFSIPTQISIYVSVSLTKTEDYAGDEQVKDNIVQYVGGLLTSGDNTSGELGVGNDVVYYQILEAVMDATGVRDVQDLQVSMNDPPSGEVNISIGDNETANIDDLSNDIEVTSSDV